MRSMEELPRQNGELIFHEEWERRVFALVVALCEAGRFEWDEFQQLLIKSINSSGGASDDNNAYQPDYYEHWLMVLEQLVVKIGIIQREHGEAGLSPEYSDKPFDAVAAGGIDEGTT